MAYRAEEKHRKSLGLEKAKKVNGIPLCNILPHVIRMLEGGYFRVTVYSTIEGLNKEKWDNLISKNKQFRLSVERAEQVFFKRFTEKWLEATKTSLSEWKEFMGKRHPEEMGQRQRVDIGSTQPVKVILKRFALKDTK